MDRTVKTLRELFKKNTVQIIRQTGRNQAYFGNGAVKCIDEIMGIYKERGIERFTVVTTKGAYKKCGAWDHCLKAFDEHGIEFVHFDKVSPNPNYTEVDEAVELGKTIDSQAILAIGGGSPIDCGKMIASMSVHTDKTGKEMIDFAFEPTKALPIVAINTTHGTGTEVDRFAVISNPETVEKPCFAFDAIYPEYSIVDPEIMLSLDKNQTLWTSLDAMNHVNEAATTNAANPYAMMMARETIDLVSEFLPVALEHPDNLEARWMLAYSALIAGIAFDNSLLHCTHAAEHPLSALKPHLAHGLGLCMILPAVDELIYPAAGKVLAELYKPILGDKFKGNPDEATEFAKSLEQWMKKMGIDTKLSHFGFKESDIPLLVEKSQIPGLVGLFSLAPVEVGLKDIEGLYQRSMDWM